MRLKVVLDKGSFPLGYGNQALVTRKGLFDAGQGRDLESLRGLTVAITPPGTATTSYAALVAALRRAGVPRDDLNIQSLAFPDMVPAMANGSIDSALMAEPSLTRALKQGSVVRIMGMDEMYPGFTVGVLGLSESLYANRPAALGFTRAYIKGIRDYLAAITGRTTEADRTEIYELVARNTRIDVATVREMVPPGFNPNGLPNMESIVYCYELFRELGQVPEPLSDAAFAALWGTDLVDEALERLGRLPES